MDFRVSLNRFLLKNETSESMLMDLIANPASFSFKINTFLFSNFFENIIMFLNILRLQSALHFAKYFCVFWSICLSLLSLGNNSSSF